MLWTSPISFVASANCARYCGAGVDFVDIDPATRLLSISALEKKLKDAKARGCLPKIVVPVHYAGLSCDMQAIAELANEYNFFVLEDAAHAIGSRYLDSRVGNCRFSDACIYSFHPVKTLTSAEGGAITTNQEQVARQCRQLLTHGITRDPKLLHNQQEGAWYYEQLALGYNFRLSDLHAALGESQLKRLDSFIAKRTQLFRRYHELLQDLPLTLPKEQSNTDSAWHLFAIEICSTKVTRREVFDYLRQRNIGVNVHYIPIHLQPDFAAFGFSKGDFPYAEQYYERTLSLPLYPDLSIQEQDYVVQSLREVLL